MPFEVNHNCKHRINGPKPHAFDRRIRLYLTVERQVNARISAVGSASCDADAVEVTVHVQTPNGRRAPAAWLPITCAVFTTAFMHLCSSVFASPSDFQALPSTTWNSLIHISFVSRYLTLQVGSHALSASLSCAGTSIAESPVMVIKCNNLPPLFDIQSGSCRWPCPIVEE